MVSRLYTGMTPLGLPFGRLAGMCGGGVQYHGFCGVSLLTVRSKKFIQGDGGWNRIAWMSQEMKQRLADVMPESIYALMPTEEDTVDLNELQTLLSQRKHPIVEQFWKDGTPVPLEIPGPGEMWPEDKHLLDE